MSDIQQRSDSFMGRIHMQEAELVWYLQMGNNLYSNKKPTCPGQVA